MSRAYRRPASLTLVTILSLAACTRPSGSPVQDVASPATERPRTTPEPSEQAIPTTARGTVGANGLPIDPSIAPVSVANATGEAADALRICQVLEVYGVDAVGGMGMIASARDAVRYAALTGREPEIQTESRAWLITFVGDIPMPRSGEIWTDPTCVVVGGDGGIFATGPVRDVATGNVTEPLAPERPPDLALPPLLP